jgi:hypothetical protein
VQTQATQPCTLGIAEQRSMWMQEHSVKAKQAQASLYAASTPAERTLKAVAAEKESKAAKANSKANIKHPEIECMQPGNNGLDVTHCAAAAARTEPPQRILRTPAGASKSINPLFESDCGMVPSHAERLSPEPTRPFTPTSLSTSPDHRSAADVNYGSMHTCEAPTTWEEPLNGDACSESVVEVTGQCSMDLAALVMSPLRRSTSASQPPQSLEKLLRRAGLTEGSDVLEISSHMVYQR